MGKKEVKHTEISVFMELVIIGIILSPVLYFGLPILSYMSWDGNLLDVLGVSENTRSTIRKSVTGIGVDSWMGAVVWGFVAAGILTAVKGILGPIFKAVFLRKGSERH